MAATVKIDWGMVSSSGWDSVQEGKYRLENKNPPQYQIVPSVSLGKVAVTLLEDSSEGCCDCRVWVREGHRHGDPCEHLVWVKKHVMLMDRLYVGKPYALKGQTASHAQIGSMSTKPPDVASQQIREHSEEMDANADASEKAAPQVQSGTTPLPVRTPDNQLPERFLGPEQVPEHTEEQPISKEIKDMALEVKTQLDQLLQDKEEHPEKYETKSKGKRRKSKK